MRRAALSVLLAEKVIQHVFVTAAFALDSASFRDDAPFDYHWFLVSGAIVAVLFAAALAGHLRRRRWALQLAIALALFDIVGEFVYQGGLGILITISLIVAVFVLLLARAELRATARAEDAPREEAPRP